LVGVWKVEEVPYPTGISIVGVSRRSLLSIASSLPPYKQSSPDVKWFSVSISRLRQTLIGDFTFSNTPYTLAQTRRQWLGTQKGVTQVKLKPGTRLEGKTTESLSTNSALAKTQTELPPTELIYIIPM